MSYTPRSEKSRTRYSTPEPDLDDHRNQPESLPPPHDQHHGARRGTLASLASVDRPNVETLQLPQMEQHASIARDFENAIIDDDDMMSVRSNASRMSKKSKRSADEDWHRERRGSNSSPIVARRSTFRRAIHNRQREVGDATSVISSRSRSSSPPNSVDAFAHPRAAGRARAGTVNSKAPSMEDLTLQRTTSNASHHHRRRGTFVEEGTAGHRTDVASRNGSVQDDVCYPPEEVTNTYTIDFEDLEEFVAQAHTKTPVAHPFTPNFAKENEKQQRVFHDMRHADKPVTAEGIDQYGNDEVLPAKEYVDEKEVDSSSSEEALKPVPSNVEQQNRWTFFSSEIDETIHAPELGSLLMPGETFRDIFELGPEGGVWWLDMLNPSEEEINAICGAFRVHPLTREDITTQESREKVEMFRNYYFVCFRSFYALDKKSEDYLEPINVYAVVFREGLLTFTFCQNSHAANVRKRIGRLRDYVNLSSDWICYALIDEIVDAFAPVLGDVENETDAIEDSVFTARFEDSRATLRQIGECRKKVTSLLRLLGGKADVIKGFAKKCNEAYAVAPRGDVGLYLSDVQDHVVTMMSNLSHFEKILARAHSNHLSQVSLAHIEQGGHSNALLGKITVFATILVPLNLIAGLFGMNVPVPGRDSQGLGWWFGIVGVILGFTLCCLAVAKKFRYV